MAEEPKKISFGFSKINKKALLSVPKKEEKGIQFIACLEENSIKLLNGEEKEKELPIIPLRNGNILRDNMIEALKARKEKRKPVSGTTDNIKTDDFKDNVETKPLTLDELAAKEILEDLNKVNENEEQETLTIPQVEDVKVSEKESTLEDYDSMPVNQFGLAVLRGMGWKPDKGIGKNAKIVEPVNPILRPKGMGLGADKVKQIVKTESKEELVMKKGAFIKVISGQNKGLYGKVEGFNDLPGRIIVRLTLQNDVISISENLVVLVTSNEYNKNSKILNLKEYNEFLDKKSLPATSEIKEKPPEKDSKKNNSLDHRNSRDKHKVESYGSRDRKKSDDISEFKYEKHKYRHEKHSSSESDSDRRTKHKSDNYKSKRRTKYDKVIVDTESSDSISSDDRKKSKSKKHRKHSSKHRSRSRSRTHKKKKRNHRNRS